MDHGAVIDTSWRHAASVAAPLLLPLLLLAALVLPGSSHASEAATTAVPGAALVVPTDGQHLDHLEVAPMVQFDPSSDASGKQETPKWVLLASDRAMTKTVRYCRQFIWASHEGAYHWGCNRWATGVDQAGNDTLVPLDPGTTYYWQVVSSSNASGGADIKSVVRSFAIDPEPKQQTIGEISDQVHGTAFDDGTQLNLGAAAFVNSGVRVTKLESSKLAPTAFRIRATHEGAIDVTRSYIKITSAAGTRYLKVATVGTDGVGTVWRLNAAERRLRTKRFTYQLYVKSTANGAMVRSQLRVLLIRAQARPPAWKPD